MNVAPSGVILRDDNWRPTKSTERQGLQKANKVVNSIDKNNNELLDVVSLLIQSRKRERSSRYFYNMVEVVEI